MLTPFESLNAKSKRNSKISPAWTWHPNRRHIMCRLPFLVVYTFIAIVILYITLSQDDAIISERMPDHVQDNVIQMSIPSRRETRISSRDIDNQLITDEYYQDEKTTSMQQSARMISDPMIDLQQTASPRIIHRTSTLKKTITEYNRRTKVCILLIQSASTTVFAKPKRSPLSVRMKQQASQGPNRVDYTLRDDSIRIPSHVRPTIEILEAHKIDYVIESTRMGLPTTLLTDSDESSLFSVIIIDDFLRYTKLDRWMRDQLDRHCRKNRIGVVTFLNPDELKEDKSSLKIENTSKPDKSAGLSTEESMTDQFPLSLKPIARSCKKRSACSYKYKLNDQSSILRILKRKRDFVVSAPFRDSADFALPWISMSSDHVTYEPLTWAQFMHSPIQTGNRFMLRVHQVDGRRGTRDINLAKTSLQNNSPQSSTRKTDVKRKRDEYDAYESPDGFNEAFGATRAVANIDVTQGYSENQLQATLKQNLRKSTALNDSNNNGQTINHANSSMMHDGSESQPYSNNAATNNSAEDYETIEPELDILAMFDRGLYDGIKRVIFGRANHHWLDRIIFLDAIEHLSSGKILTPLERYIQIDIDDIFVGEQGKRMNRSDVDALIAAQERFSQLIDGGFKFNLGFSGKYYMHGNDNENAGDEYLISRANNFYWFCHTWSHSKAHLMKDTDTIENELRQNLQFARQHRLPIIGHGGPLQSDNVTLPETYAVAPHHSGVYPVHEQLYEAWLNVLNVRVTTTEEYPSLRPAHKRQAFVHKTIKVLPRQTCGLYTHTIYESRYPGGIEKLKASINGGELFETILHNPVNIYMTHMSNYAHDRLALSTFSALIEFVQMYTNLQLKYVPSDKGQLGPSRLADYYFNLFPQQQQPLWTNPCKDKRHLAIWAPDKHEYCSAVPDLLIVGPQKTGTTALYSFLKLHPEFRSSIQSPVDFEEVQFFNDKHYSRGVDWYFSRFLSSSEPDGVSTATTEAQSNGQLYYFDKSATYYDDPKVASRARSLLPEAKIVISLVDPADRAYSWYQHIKAHGDSIANSMSFEQIIMSKDDDNIFNDGIVAPTFEDINGNVTSGDRVTKELRALRNRCLQPGYYSVHLSRWLDHFPSRQIIIIDGQWFRQNPASVMNKLQLILRVSRRIDYENILVYSEQKGFYCHRSTAASLTRGGQKPEINCLGPSKGRKYPGMARETRLFLNRHYLAYNKQLARLLSDIGQPLPVWLEEAINVGRQRHVATMVFS